MYQALYRKYRPKQFCDITGQQHITETLRTQVLTDRLSHAYLFVGTRGTGKTTCAKILSRAVNCLNPANGEPCNECASCTGIDNGTILDVVELDAASNNSVDDVRELRQEAIYSPAAVSKRVYILDEAHMLSNSAVNALLKILEEPPKHVIFILATTELHKMPATIQSRCQKFFFKRLLPEQIAKRLTLIARNENLTITDEAAATLAALADGSMRDGISLLDQCISDKPIDAGHIKETLGLVAEDELLCIINAIAGNDTLTIIETIDKLYTDGKDMASLLNAVSGLIRDILVIKLIPGTYDTTGSIIINKNIPGENLLAAAKLYDTNHLLSCLDTAKTTMAGISRTGISRLILEMCLIKMCNAPEQTPEPTAKPAPKSAPKPAPLPEPAEIQEAVQAPEPASETAGGILSQIKNTIADKSITHLFDGCSARLSDGKDTLIFAMPDELRMNMIRPHSDILKAAVNKVFGKEIAVRMEIIRDNTKNNQKSKLDELLKHDIVKIEGGE